MPGASSTAEPLSTVDTETMESLSEPEMDTAIPSATPGMFEEISEPEFDTATPTATPATDDGAVVPSATPEAEEDNAVPSATPGTEEDAEPEPSPGE